MHVNSPALAQDEPGACDFLAAHPDDPNGIAAGVVDGEIETSEAIGACEAALSTDPDNARLQFQLGRSFWEADRDQEAIDLFRESAVGGNYAAAFAFLGIAYEYGYVTGDPEVEVARALYHVALDAEFTPAELLLAGLSDPQPSNLPQDADPISFEGYYQKEFLDALYHERFNDLNEKGFKVVLYLRGMYDFFKQEVNWFDLRCAHLHDTRLTQKIVRNLFNAQPGEFNANFEGIISRFMAHFQKRLAQGDIAGGINDLLDVGIYPDEGKRDAGHLVTDHTDEMGGYYCEADTIKRLYKNAQYYFLREMSFR